MPSFTIFISNQYQFNYNEECLVDAIIYGTKVQKARKKLLQIPKHLTLKDCLKICHHYESLQYHLNVIRLMDKSVKSISRCHFNHGGKQQHQPGPSSKKSGSFRSQPTNKPSNSTNNTSLCSNCDMQHAKN